MIVVELKPGASWSESTPLFESANKDTRVAKVYKAGEIPSSHVNNQFVVGTNESDNVSLKPNTTYAFYVRWIAQEEVCGLTLYTDATDKSVCRYNMTSVCLVCITCQVLSDVVYCLYRALKSV